METTIHPMAEKPWAQTTYILYGFEVRIKEKLQRHLKIKSWKNRLCYEWSRLGFVRNELSFAI